jgi:ATP-dependent helicase/nuclease subunit B
VFVYADDGSANGVSRYVAQLANELFRDRPDRWVVSDARVHVPVRATTQVQVPRTEATQAAIRGRLAKGMSPTMLRTWLKCPLDFWFRYVQGLNEPEAPGVRIANNDLGNALHAVVEGIYRPLLGRPLDPHTLLGAIEGVPKALRDELSRKLPDTLLAEGQPFLQVGMAARAAQAFLRAGSDTVKQGAHIVPISLEDEVVHPLEGAIAQVTIKGRLDRVDAREGVIHILDLKTGRVDDGGLRIKDVSLEALRGEKGYGAQLLVYAWLWFTTHREVETLRTGLLPLQRASANEGTYLRIDNDDVLHRSILPAITDLLHAAVAEMLDPDRPFVHDPKSTYCVFCASVP